jgi:class 3 adenylate cyclase/tetratricopeptide (TPR) repeat protein/ribosomal protein L40E
MKCPKCQFENREEAVFCRSCGASLVSDISCPNCDASNPPDSKFCEKCGQGIKPPEKIRSLKYSEPQSYTPKFLADKILKTRSSIEGERKLVTVFFADVANYTAMSEKIDPEEIHQIMDGCFKLLMDEIHTYEGTINQFTGDGVMALFGAPVAHEDHAQRACYAALSIQKSIKAYGEKIEKDTGHEFKLRMGLNSGPVIVGSIGDDLRLDYTAVGDTTNLASRMEGKARPGSILVSENTYKLVSDYFQFESLGKINVKGKETPQQAYELNKPSEVKTRIGASVAKGLIRFVGRNNSLVALNESYNSIQSGSGQVVGIVGEAGVGKSRLLLEFVNQLPQREFTYFEGRCIHYGSSVIYMPILDILRHFFDIDEADREFIIKKKIKEKILSIDEKLKISLPSFQELLSVSVDDDEYQRLEPKQKRDRNFDAIRDLFIQISHKKPLVVAFEDLHWIDKTSEEFIDYLIGSLAKSRIMLILLYRPEYIHQWGSRSYYNRISVNELGTGSSAELISDRLSEFYEILAYQYSKSGNLEKTCHYSKLSGEKAAANFSNWEAYGFYKQSLNALAKLSQTEDIKKSQVEICVAAYNTSWVLGCPEDTIQILEKGVRLSKEVKDDKRLARFYGFRGAYHQIKGEPQDAIRYTEIGLKKAQRTRDVGLVANLTTVILVLYNNTGEFLKTVGKAPDVIRSLEEAKKETEIFVSLFFNTYSVLIAHYGLGLGWLGNFAEGFNQIGKGLKFSRSIKSVPDLALLEWLYGTILFIKGDAEKTIVHMEKSLNYTEKGGVLLFTGMVYSILGAGYYLKGDLTAAKKFIEKGLKIQLDIKRTGLLSFIYTLLGMVAFESGDIKNAKNNVEIAVKLSQECGEKQYEGVSRIWLGKILYSEDSLQIDKAEASILQGINLLNELKIKPYISIGALFLGEIYALSDQKEKAIVNLDHAKLMFQKLDMRYWLTKTLAVLGRLQV